MFRFRETGAVHPQTIAKPYQADVQSWQLTSGDKSALVLIFSLVLTLPPHWRLGSELKSEKARDEISAVVSKSYRR